MRDAVVKDDLKITEVDAAWQNPASKHAKLESKAYNCGWWGCARADMMVCDEYKCMDSHHKIIKYRDEWLDFKNPLDNGNKQWKGAMKNDAWLI